MEKRILIFSQAFYPHVLGGVENYLISLSKNLVKKSIKIDICVFNTLNLNSFEKYEGINIYRIPCKTIFKGIFNEKTKVRI